MVRNDAASDSIAIQVVPRSRHLNSSGIAAKVPAGYVFHPRLCLTRPSDRSMASLSNVGNSVGTPNEKGRSLAYSVRNRPFC